jgi:hypothetical protein
MMLDRLVDQLRQRGLTVKPGKEPGQLVLAGPAAEKTPEVMKAVKAFKPQLLERFGVAQPDPTGEPREDVVTDDPKAPAPPPAGLTAVEPHHCQACNALVLAVPDTVTDAFCERPTCPYRGRTGSTSSTGSRATRSR